jgi:Putative metal-binding motif
MRLRLTSLVGFAVSVVACATDVTCPRGAAENDAGFCVDLPTDSSVSAAATNDDARPPRDPDASRIDAGSEADGNARSDAADDTPDGGAVANDAGTPATNRDAEAVGLDGSPDDAASPTVDAGPTCVPSTEVCNGKDDDCDQKVDEDVSEAPIGTACSNGGPGVCSAPGKQVCSAGAIVCNAPPPMPSAELCDGVDNDCNNKVDEAFADKGKACTAGTGDCVGTGIFECDPTDPSKLRCAAMAKAKTCGDSCAPQPTSECSAGSGDCNSTASWACDTASSTWKCPAAAKPVTCAATGSCAPQPAEVCDGIDNDCDGQIDEDFFGNVIRDPGFESQSSTTVALPWQNLKGATIESAVIHAGKRAAKVMGDLMNGTSYSNWNDVFQRIAVEPNKNYKLQAWIRTSDTTTYARLGVRATPPPPLTQNCTFETCPELAQNLGAVVGFVSDYQLVSTLFNSGNNTSVEAYIGLSTGAGEVSTILYADDVVVQRVSCD